jgi:hypothetical protein
MNEPAPNPSAQAQDNIVEDVHIVGDNTVFTFAPVQIGTKIETQIVQISVDIITQRPLIKASPYRGLKRFNFSDRDRFFGRDRLIAQLLQAVNQSSFSLVLGASGSGKSSVLRAGVIPELKKSLEPVTQFYDFVLTPNNNPFDSLYRCLLSEEKDYNFRRTDVELAMKVGANTLSQVISKLKQENERWLIFIDQFEELFTLCQDLETRKSFIDGIVQVATAGDSSVRLVLAMRADFLEQFSFYPALGALGNQSNIHLVTEMHPDALCQAIEQPAALNGVVFEEGLVKQIIGDVEGQSGYLPLLQYTLNLLWNTECKTIGADGRANIDRRTLHKSSYTKLGGVKGALQQHINGIYGSLSKEEKLATQKIFLKLVDVSKNEERGTEWRPIRRRANKSEFVGQLELKVLHDFINKNLLVSNQLQGAQQPTVEVAHEILFSSWETLRIWIGDNREAISLRNRLNHDVKLWEENKKAESELWNGSKLEKVLELRKDSIFIQVLGGFDNLANEFINASVKKRDRQQQIKITVASIISVLSITVLIASGFAWLKAQEAEESFRKFLLGIDPFKPELLEKLPSYLKYANQLKRPEKLDLVLAYHRRILSASDELQSYIELNPKEHSKLFQKAKTLEIRGQAEKSIIQVITEYQLPKIRELLRSGQRGRRKTEAELERDRRKINPNFNPEKDEIYDYLNLEDNFTEGALRDTYGVLMGKFGLGADGNGNGMLDKNEASRIPCILLKELEEVWKQETNHHCGWYGKNFEVAPECQQLEGHTLTTLIFEPPYDIVLDRFDQCRIGKDNSG